MKHDITFYTDGKRFKLNLLNAVEVVSSVENLVDTATITLPETIMNKVLNIEDKVKRGSKVEIKLGYDRKEDLNTEFVGYVRQLNNRDGSLLIECEDALFLFRKAIPNKLFEPAKVEDVLKYVIKEIDPSFKLVMDVDYGVTYEKFTIYQAEGYDVLKKVQEELALNIYFDSEKKELHVHPPFFTKGGKVKYDMSRNVEQSNLEYKKEEDRKIEIVIQRAMPDGTTQEFSYGTTGGEKETFKVGQMDSETMKNTAKNRWLQMAGDRYEGDITTWLLPMVRPGYTATFIDNDYKARNGQYYVNAVTTSFSESGGVRTVTFGIKL